MLNIVWDFQTQFYKIAIVSQCHKPKSADLPQVIEHILFFRTKFIFLVSGQDIGDLAFGYDDSTLFHNFLVHTQYRVDFPHLLQSRAR